jgi:hypothetical protein
LRALYFYGWRYGGGGQTVFVQLQEVLGEVEVQEVFQLVLLQVDQEFVVKVIRVEMLIHIVHQLLMQVKFAGGGGGAGAAGTNATPV